MSFEHLLTEHRNPDSQNLDLLSTMEILRVIQREDEKVALAVRPALPDIAQAVDWIAETLRKGGRLFYIGAGTSGRLGVLDAAECPPTFNTPPEMIQAILAGGADAMFAAVEGAEDDLSLAENDLRQRRLSCDDIVVGLSASGRTPYVWGALNFSRSVGAKTVAVVCVPEAELKPVADITVSVLVGPEVIAGSTRLKAGTAQKMVLNMLSTAAMVKLGKTYGNLMIDVRATNAKLTARILRMVRDTTGASANEASDALTKAGGSAKVAIVMLLAGLSANNAYACIEQAHGSVRQALSIAGYENLSRSSGAENGYEA